VAETQERYLEQASAPPVMQERYPEQASAPPMMQERYPEQVPAHPMVQERYMERTAMPPMVQERYLERALAPPVMQERYPERTSAPSMAQERPFERSYASSYAPPPKRRGGVLRVICLILVCILVAGGTGAFVTRMILRDFEAVHTSNLGGLPGTQDPVLPSPPPAQGNGGLGAEGIYALARHQVVGVRAEILATSVVATGTGFIISSDGYILTNYHVVQGAAQIIVTLENGGMYEARLIGREFTTSDLAVLKIEATGLSPVTIGDSSDLQVGTQIYVVGHPLGMTYTIIQGAVSALNRQIVPEPGQTIMMFQIDAIVNSGNSGGPVFNEVGEVIGIVTARSLVDGEERMGFAIPIGDALRYADRIIEQGYAPDDVPDNVPDYGTGPPQLGISAMTVTEEYAEEMGVVLGALVEAIDAGSPAELAEMRVGDIIVTFGGVPITSVEELLAILEVFAPGDMVRVTVFRDGAGLDLLVTLRGAP